MQRAGWEGEGKTGTVGRSLVQTQLHGRRRASASCALLEPSLRPGDGQRESWSDPMAGNLACDWHLASDGVVMGAGEQQKKGRVADKEQVSVLPLALVTCVFCVCDSLCAGP